MSHDEGKERRETYKLQFEKHSEGGGQAPNPVSRPAVPRTCFRMGTRFELFPVVAVLQSIAFRPKPKITRNPELQTG